MMSKILIKEFLERKHLSLDQRLDLGEMVIKAKTGCEQSYFDLVGACYAYNKIGYDTSYFDGVIVEEVLPLYKHKMVWVKEYGRQD